MTWLKKKFWKEILITYSLNVNRFSHKSIRRIRFACQLAINSYRSKILGLNFSFENLMIVLLLIFLFISLLYRLNA